MKRLSQHTLRNLAQVLQEVTGHHLCWQGGANLVASLTPLAVI